MDDEKWKAVVVAVVKRPFYYYHIEKRTFSNTRLYDTSGDADDVNGTRATILKT